MEKIISIDGDNGFGINNNYYNYDGYVIVTTEQTIKIGISNSQDCCESWGVEYTTDSISDNLEQFIGAELYSIAECSDPLEDNHYYDGGGSITIDLKTSKGSLKIILSNSHNGYYFHSYIIESNQFKDSGHL